MDIGGDAIRRNIRLASVQGTASRIERERLNSLVGTWQLFTSAMSAAQIALGRALSPTVRGFLATLAEMFSGLRNWIENNREMVGSVFKVVAAIVGAIIGAGAFAAGIRIIGMAIGAILSPLGVFIGIAAGVVLAMQDMGDAGFSLAGIFKSLQDIGAGMGRFIAAAFQRLKPVLVEIGMRVLSFIQAMGMGIAAGQDPFVQWGILVGDILGNVLRILIQVTEAIGTFVGRMLGVRSGQDAWQGLLTGVTAFFDRIANLTTDMGMTLQWVWAKIKANGLEAFRFLYFHAASAVANMVELIPGTGNAHAGIRTRRDIDNTAMGAHILANQQTAWALERRMRETRETRDAETRSNVQRMMETQQRVQPQTPTGPIHSPFVGMFGGLRDIVGDMIIGEARRITALQDLGMGVWALEGREQGNVEARGSLEGFTDRQRQVLHGEFGDAAFSTPRDVLQTWLREGGQNQVFNEGFFGRLPEAMGDITGQLLSLIPPPPARPEDEPTGPEIPAGQVSTLPIMSLHQRIQDALKTTGEARDRQRGLDLQGQQLAMLRNINTGVGRLGGQVLT